MLMNWLHEPNHFVAKVTCFFIYLIEMFRLLCPVRLILHFVCRINQCFLIFETTVQPKGLWFGDVIKKTTGNFSSGFQSDPNK